MDKLFEEKGRRKHCGGGKKYFDAKSGNKEGWSGRGIDMFNRVREEIRILQKEKERGVHITVGIPMHASDQSRGRLSDQGGLHPSDHNIPHCTIHVALNTLNYKPFFHLNIANN
mmetsp:Transcript_12010/g.34417  ORF Transcript_12010/g.34417 Transcript_12010/m.34417 type:complete len:114 (-) Transcript_12010:1696-2037(-)